MAEWVQIPEFLRYSVSEDGRIRNDDTGRILRLGQLPDGRIKVGMMLNGIQYQRSVSRLVLQAFVPNRDPHRSDTPIHLDGDLRNCAAYNLSWRPRWFAKAHTRQFRLGWPDTDPIRNIDTDEHFSGVWELVCKYGLLRSDVLECVGRDWPVYPLMQRFDWVE